MPALVRANQCPFGRRPAARRRPPAHVRREPSAGRPPQRSLRRHRPDSRCCRVTLPRQRGRATCSSAAPACRLLDPACRASMSDRAYPGASSAGRVPTTGPAVSCSRRARRHGHHPFRLCASPRQHAANTTAQQCPSNRQNSLVRFVTSCRRLTRHALPIRKASTTSSRPGCRAPVALRIASIRATVCMAPAEP